MKKTYREIKNSIPGIDSEKVEVLSDELDRVLALKSLVDSEGGKELIKLIRANCFITLRKLVTQAKESPTLEQLLGTIAMYSANIQLLSELQDITMEEELRRQLDEAVKEVYREV